MRGPVPRLGAWPTQGVDGGEEPRGAGSSFLQRGARRGSHDGPEQGPHPDREGHTCSDCCEGSSSWVGSDWPGVGSKRTGLHRSVHQEGGRSGRLWLWAGAALWGVLRSYSSVTTSAATHACHFEVMSGLALWSRPLRTLLHSQMGTTTPGSGSPEVRSPGSRGEEHVESMLGQKGCPPSVSFWSDSPRPAGPEFRLP